VLQDLGVFTRLAAAHVHDHLVDLGDLHDALVAELLHQSGSDFGSVFFFQSGHLSALLSYSSAPQCLHTRVFLPPSILWATRVPLLHLGHTTCTLQEAMAASRFMMPPSSP